MTQEDATTQRETTGEAMDNTHRTRVVRELIESLPSAVGCICSGDNDWCVSTEWLVGTLSARGFVAVRREDALAEMCSYFDRHVGHDSLVGAAVTASGWPDLERVRAYCEQEDETP